MTPQSSRSATRLKIKLGVRKGQATDGAEDDVGGIAGATFEITAAEVTFCFHMSNHRLDRTPRASVARRCVGRIFAIPFLSLDFYQAETLSATRLWASVGPSCRSRIRAVSSRTTT